MKRALQRDRGKGALELIEEAVHLIRRAPAASLAAYYIGTTPFLLGLLFFQADMAGDPFASRRLPEASMGVALLYLWMKCCQAAFARRLWASIASEPLPRLHWREPVRVFMLQSSTQPILLFLAPLMLIPVWPLSQARAFFENCTILAGESSGGIRSHWRRAWTQAALWPRQNMAASAILLAFGAVVWLNWFSFGLALPYLIKMLLGIESVFSRSGTAIANTSLVTASAALTWLSVDPIVKAFFTLKCFYGESVQSGADLKADLKRWSTPGSAAAVIAVAALWLAATPRLLADDEGNKAVAQPSPSATGFQSADLDRALNQVIHRPKFVWRMPRPNLPESEAEESAVAKFIHDVAAKIRHGLRAVFEWLKELWEKWMSREPSQGPSYPSGGNWAPSIRALIYTLIVVVIALIVWAAWRAKQTHSVVLSTPEAAPPAPDVSDESVGADKLPEDGWSRLARELAERGDWRLAMRAYYFAGLANLAARNLIALARFKSNHDYERELIRRAHAIPNLVGTFSEGLRQFEGIWYGDHEVNRESVARFADMVEQIKAV